MKDLTESLVGMVNAGRIQVWSMVVVSFVLYYLVSRILGGKKVRQSSGVIKYRLIYLAFICLNRIGSIGILTSSELSIVGLR